MDRMDVDDRYKTLKLVGLQGYKFRGVELDKLGLNTSRVHSIDQMSSLDLLTLQLRAAILQHVFNIITLLIYVASYIEPFIWGLYRWCNPIKATHVPAEVAFILQLPKFLEPIPAAVPEPYLTSDRLMILPSDKEIQLAKEKIADYRRKEQVFMELSRFEKLQKVSMLIGYCAKLGIKNCYFYESTDELWEVENLQEQITDLVKLQLRREGITRGVKIVDHGHEYMIANTTNDNDDIITVTLLCYTDRMTNLVARQLQSTLEIDLEIPQHRPELIVECDNAVHNFHKLMGYPVQSTDDPRECVIHNLKDMRFESFIEAISVCTL